MEPFSSRETISARGLKKSFGHNRVLKGIDFTIHPGEFWVIFGPNGAGKTTLTWILATLLKPTAGELLINETSVEKTDVDFRRRVGMVSHQTFLYNDLTARENLVFFGKLYDVDHLSDAAERILRKVGLSRWADQRVRNLSRGMQQRLAIARALLPDPSVLLLDEPYSGLDQQATERLQHLLQSLHTSMRTIFLTTHNVKIGLSLYTHLAVIAQGRIVFQAPRTNLKEKEFENIYASIVEKGQR